MKILPIILILGTLLIVGSTADQLVGNKTVEELCEIKYKNWTEEIDYYKIKTLYLNTTVESPTGMYFNSSNGKYYDIVKVYYNTTVRDYIEYIPHINKQVDCKKTGELDISGKILAPYRWGCVLIGSSTCCSPVEDGGRFADFSRTDNSVDKCCKDLISNKVECTNPKKVVDFD